MDPIEDGRRSRIQFQDIFLKDYKKVKESLTENTANFKLPQATFLALWEKIPSIQGKENNFLTQRIETATGQKKKET